MRSWKSKQLRERCGTHKRPPPPHGELCANDYRHSIGSHHPHGELCSNDYRHSIAPPPSPRRVVRERLPPQYRPPPPPRRVVRERCGSPPSKDTSKSGTVGFAHGDARPLRPSAFLLFALFAYFLSLSSFRERRKRENRQKNTPASDIKKKPLPRGEVSRLHRDGEGVNDSGKVHLTRTPLFL